MSRTTTIVLAVLLILGLAVAMFISTPTAPKSDLPTSFLPFLPSEARSLGVATPNEEIHLERDAGDRERWRVRVGNVLVRADSLKVEDILNDLSRLEPKNLWRKAEVRPDERESWGLEKPTATVTLSLEGRTLKASFGERTLDGRNCYAERDADGDAWMVPSAGMEAVSSISAADLRAKRPVEFSKYDAKSVSLNRADGLVLEAAKAPGGTSWDVIAPFRGAADPVRMDEFLAKVLSVEIADFVSDGAPDLDRFGLVEPRATISLRREGRDEPVVLKFGTEAGEGKAYFMEEGEPSVYACAKDVAAAVLGLEAEALRDRNLLRVGWTKLQAMEYVHPGKGWKFLRVLDHWDLEKPERVPADGNRVEDLLKTIRELAVSKFLDGEDPAALGLESAEKSYASLVLTGVDEDGNRTLLLGRRNEDGTAPARLLPSKEGAEAPPPVLVDAAFLERLEAGWLHWRTREVLALEVSEVRGITRKTAEGEETYLRDHGGVWKAAPGGKEPDRDALTAALTHLLTLNCSSYAARTKEGLDRWGLGDPPATAAITVHHRKDAEKEERRTTLILGGKVEGADAHHARRADGDTVFVLPDRILNGADIVPFFDLLTAGWSRGEEGGSGEPGPPQEPDPPEEREPVDPKEPVDPAEPGRAEPTGDEPEGDSPAKEPE